MEATEVLMGLLGMAVAVIVGLAALLRRSNGKNNSGHNPGNPGLEVVEVLLQQLLQGQRDAGVGRQNIVNKLDGLTTAVTAMQGVVSGCASVQELRDRRGG